MSLYVPYVLILLKKKKKKILKLRSSEILNSRQQTAMRFNGMATEGQMVGTNAAVRQTEVVKYSVFIMIVWQFV